MLMQASLLRGLFSAGRNVFIDPDGVISTTAVVAGGSAGGSGGPFAGLPVVAALAAQDLVAVSHAGSNSAIAYGNLLGGMTIDQAQAAGPVNDTDKFWAAQGNNAMVGQNFGAIWFWIAARLSTYKVPIVEIATNTSLDATVHNGRVLICSQPLKLTPLPNAMASGFQCTLINASTGNVTLGSGFVSSSGSLTLMPWQSASLFCISYSGGAISYAAISGPSTGIATPGQVTGVATSGTTSTTINLMWQTPSNGGVTATYLIQYRISGTSSWTSVSSGGTSTLYRLTGLQPGTSYDILVQGQNATGPGLTSAILTATTSSSPLAMVPGQVSSVSANPISSSAVQLTWAAPTGANAATSFTVQYRITGTPTWLTSVGDTTATTATVSNLQATTAYDFCVTGVNSTGAGLASTTMHATTPASSQAVTSIVWGLSPSGTYARSSGAIGVNAHVTPGVSPIQFGFSLSATTPPSSWIAAVLVNTDLWGAYIPTPAIAGNWYAWVEGLDGSAATVSLSPFVVQ